VELPAACPRAAGEVGELPDAGEVGPSRRRRTSSPALPVPVRCLPAPAWSSPPTSARSYRCRRGPRGNRERGCRLPAQAGPASRSQDAGEPPTGASVRLPPFLEAPNPSKLSGLASSSRLPWLVAPAPGFRRRRRPSPCPPLAVRLWCPPCLPSSLGVTRQRSRPPCGGSGRPFLVPPACGYL
jgi:hypothetical protein